MRYLVTSNANPPFYTNWFNPEDHFVAYTEMVVYDLTSHKYTIDGRCWWDIKFDNL